MQKIVKYHFVAALLGICIMSIYSAFSPATGGGGGGFAIVPPKGSLIGLVYLFFFFMAWSVSLVTFLLLNSLHQPKEVSGTQKPTVDFWSRLMLFGNFIGILLFFPLSIVSYIPNSVYIISAAVNFSLGAISGLKTKKLPLVSIIVSTLLWLIGLA